jgi:uncharacterized iron-regulated protein
VSQALKNKSFLVLFFKKERLCFISRRTTWTIMRHSIVLLILLLSACAVKPAICPPQSWVSPVSLQAVADPLPDAAAKPVVLLGEAHDNPADHRWELATIQSLARLHPRLVIGFEMFPRRAQPVLDRWVQGGLSEPDFLRETGFHAFWGFDPDFYLPIFRFARDHRIPMLALNVSRALVHRVAQHGWDAVPAEDREGVARPAPPSAAYRASLADAMAGHGGPAMNPARLAHFIEAQTVWDGAMAQAILTRHAQAPGALIVAVMGAGHLEDRSGVPHQLDASGVGVDEVAVLLPSHGACAMHGPGFADAVFVDGSP